MKLIASIFLIVMVSFGVVEGYAKTGNKVKVITKLRYEVNKRTKGVDQSIIEWAWAVLFRQDKPGAKRLAEEVPDTLPMGEVLLMPEGLIVGFDSNKYKKITDLKIYDTKTKKLIFSKKEIKDLLLIPKKYFTYDRNYKIRCIVFSNSHIINIDDEFQVLSLKEHKEFKKYVGDRLKNLKDKNVKDFILAILYYDYGYDYNGNVKILEILKD